ncbi:MAG: hypothetical protein KF681_08755 [Bdellovibrionaceae bacterium]|nr:hypothetical protein [Pseudobdellovibrionaceae bacterium]
MKTAMMTTLLVMAPVFGFAAEGAHEHNLQEACKAECPAAKTEDEAHKCMEGVVKKKKEDRKFRKSDCFSAFKEHEKHEKAEGHNH